MFTLRKLLLGFLCASPCLSVADAEITDDDLIRIFGEAAEYRRVFNEVQSTIRDDDREGFAALVHYPFTIYREKKTCCGSDAVDTIEDSEEFIEKFDEIVTPGVRAAIKNQDFNKLSLGWRGLGFDLGVLWIVGHCVSDDETDPCAETIVGVQTIHADAAANK